MMNDHPALYWEYNPVTEKCDCRFCPHFCHISDQKLGLCKTRRHRNKMLIAENYGKVSSLGLDPIEKKPLYHFKPGSRILSLGTYGCNMRCSFCQNYQISQMEPRTETISAIDIVSLLSHVNDSIGIAFTYNEPFMGYEFMLDAVREVKRTFPDMAVVVVTNGYVNPEPLQEILPYIDAFNIDLKTFYDDKYHTLCGATLNPVLKTIETASKKSHVEVTTLMVTGENDTVEEIEKIAQYLSGISRNIPLHLSRYFPNYKMTRDATDIGLINEARSAAEKYLDYVYVGNLEDADENTYCPSCGKLLIERHHYHTVSHLTEPTCPVCKKEIPIVL